MENLVSYDYLSSFYKGKKIFITGHTGFKGSWLSSLLYKLGAIVKGYALEPEYENSLYSILKPLKISESIIADIRDKERLKHEILIFQPDFIFHLAAQPLVRRSYKIPAETFEVNVVGTANLLETAIELNQKCSIVVITTDKVYENKEKLVLYHEDDILGGYDPYSASKACTELVVSSFRNSFFNTQSFKDHHKAIASARAGNVIGGGDWSEDRIIPDIVSHLQNNQPILVRNPKAIRPWQHVLEPLSGYLLLGGLLNKDPLKYSKAYNFGPFSDDHLTVSQLVENAIHFWGQGQWKDISGSDQPHEAGILQLDINKALKELTWHPKLTSRVAIEWTIDWYKKRMEDKVDCTFNQIDQYLSL